MQLIRFQSSYLAIPSRHPSRTRRSRPDLRSFVFRMFHGRPRLISRSLIGLAIWGTFYASFEYITTPHLLSTQLGQTVGQAATISSNLAIKPVTGLGAAVAASTLPGGATGQLLPPGTMAPDRTFANSYAHGQCTWYVAGRRQIPSNWGNARNWYYNAISNHWSVGTTPAIAAIAWTSAGYYGHVALVENISEDGDQVYISEMNNIGVGIKDFRWVPTTSFKYIY